MTLEELKILSNQHKILSLSVDFIITSYDTSHAKNLDTARYILVTATENGLPRRILASEKPKLRLHKPDDTYVYNSCEVIEDGRVLVRLTEQIMAYPGTASCDIQIATADGAVYTTKIFHIVIDIPAYDNSVIESSNEFGELNRLISGEQEHIEAVKNLEKTLTENEEIRNTNEQSRQNSENTRQSNESERAAAEAQRQDNEAARALAENARQDSENSRTAAESSRAANEALRQSQETTRQSDTAAAVSEAEAAARKAADAADDLRDKLDSHYFALAEDLISHDTDNAAHNDIRELLSSLAARLNTLADSDDSTLDQLSEIVAYIKDNRELIEIVTTNKVNVSDIVDSLSSSAAGKPLSANQGRLLKQLISTLEETLDLKADSSFKKISVGPASISAASKDDTLTLSAGSNITLTADSANNKITISSSGGGSVTVDSSLNAASVNPVQNKAVYEAFSKYLPLSGGTMKGTAYFGSQSYYINTSGVASMNTVSNPSGALNLLGKSSIHLRSNSGNIVIDASSPSNGHLSFSDTNYSNAFTGEMYIVTLGTASENGRFRLRLGNSTPSGTGGNYSGELLIYSPSSYYWYLLGNKAITANHAIYFPNAGGQFVVSANNTAVGSTNTPVYITSNGEVKACGHSFGSYLPLAGGTLTGDVILNRSSAVATSYRVKNPVRDLGLHVAASGNAGLYDQTNKTWIIYSNPEQNVYIPHPTNVIGNVCASSDIKANIGLAFGLNSGTTEYAIYTLWKDNNNHNIISRHSDGLTASVGWVGSSNYQTTTQLRGYIIKFHSYGNNIIPFADNSYYLGNGSYRFKQIFAVNGAIATSDRVQKRDINYDLEKTEAIFDALKPCSFYRVGGDRQHWGLIAQDVEQSLLDNGLTLDDVGIVCRDHMYVDEEDSGKLYQYNDDGTPKYNYGLRYEELHGLEIYQIQALKKRVAELEKIINKSV